jgi:hypothetical protein
MGLKASHRFTVRRNNPAGVTKEKILNQCKEAMNYEDYGWITCKLASLGARNWGNTKTSHIKY